MMRFCTVALLCAMLFAVPASGAEQPADPQVAYANAHRTGAIGYSQGWFGKSDQRLHYVEAGTGPLVILYHGFPSNWFGWFDLMEELKTSYRVVAVDGLGAGLSAKPQSLHPYRVDRLGRQLDRFARHLNGNRPFILIGHDWGGALGLAYAQAYPGRLHAVVGMSAPPYNLFLDLVRDNPEQRQRSGYMQQFQMLSFDQVKSTGAGVRLSTTIYGSLRDQGALSAEEAALFIASIGPPETMNGGMNWYRANVPLFDQLDRARPWPRHNRPISAPTLMIWGEADGTFVPDFLASMPRYATNLSVIRLPDVGHMTPIEKSDQSTKAIAAFLDGICGKAAKIKC